MCLANERMEVTNQNHTQKVTKKSKIMIKTKRCILFGVCLACAHARQRRVCQVRQTERIQMRMCLPWTKNFVSSDSRSQISPSLRLVFVSFRILFCLFVCTSPRSPSRLPSSPPFAPMFICFLPHCKALPQCNAKK